MRTKDDIMANILGDPGDRLITIDILAALLDIRDALVRIAPSDYALELKSDQEKVIRASGGDRQG